MASTSPWVEPMAKMSRVKGATFERVLANLFKQMWPTAKRGIGQTRSASEVPDVDGTPFWVEAKHWKKTTRTGLRKAYQQAVDANRTTKPIVVIAKENCSRDIVVVMSALDFMSTFKGVTASGLPHVQFYLDEFVQLCVKEKVGGARAPEVVSSDVDETQQLEDAAS